MLANDTNIKDFLFRRHAYLLIGEREFWRKTLETELKKFLKIENLTSSPDIWWQDYESFGLKEAQALMEREARHGFGEQGRFFILGISSMTPEAQNALLKTFEEPALDAHFFIMARTAEIFLPTLRSRLVILTDRQLGSLTSKLKIDAKIERNEVGFCASAEEVVLQVSPKSDFGSADQFLKMDLPERLDFIQKEFLKPKDKKKSEIIDFVIELEKTLRAQINMRQITKDEEFALHELAKCQRYFQNPRSSNRLILEHLALVIPLN